MTMTETTKSGLLAGTPMKKNGFRRLSPGVYHLQFVEQIQENIWALLRDDLDAATMVLRDKRTLGYKLRIGIGKKNRWVPNPYHEQHEYLEFRTIEAVIEALKELLEQAQSGVYDEKLDELMVARQQHAINMAKQRKDNYGTFAPLQIDQDKAVLEHQTA